MNTASSSLERQTDQNFDRQQMRRLDLLKKAGLFSPIPSEIKCSQATTVEDFRSAYNVVYNAYIEKRYILPNSTQMRVRPWETFPGNGTFICKTDNKVIGVTGTVMDSQDILLPSDHAFHTELEEIRNEGAVICEISNQSIVPEYRNTSVVTELMQAAYGHAWFTEATDLVCAISPKQRKFFELMGFEQVGDIKSYTDIVFDPVALLRLRDIQGRYSPGAHGNKALNAFWNAFFITQNPYIPIYPLWQRMVRGLFNSKAKLGELFGGCTELFTDASIQEQAAMERNLGAAYSSLRHSAESVAHVL